METAAVPAGETEKGCQPEQKDRKAKNHGETKTQRTEREVKYRKGVRVTG